MSVTCALKSASFKVATNPSFSKAASRWQSGVDIHPEDAVHQAPHPRVGRDVVPGGVDPRLTGVSDLPALPGQAAPLHEAVENLAQLVSALFLAHLSSVERISRT